jgi:hypothetical protein
LFFDAQGQNAFFLQGWIRFANMTKTNIYTPEHPSSTSTPDNTPSPPPGFGKHTDGDLYRFPLTSLPLPPELQFLGTKMEVRTVPPDSALASVALVGKAGSQRMIETVPSLNLTGDLEIRVSFYNSRICSSPALTIAPADGRGWPWTSGQSSVDSFSLQIDCDKIVLDTKDMCADAR